ncbi:hypothetical protein Agabi119p4_11054 [Agaricus bisporus var. burnettii]|uniref:Uncharacterized protein n=1 Tax=Agaricus bisporus var. burnettii TaxID=192524 RepID=A0A8H7C199_AGABI|nr:hypothetical protein Agabi119p4_11054 [Agaricus bisporus var. burnettii]
MTPSRPLNPRKAWIFGYRISFEDWCQWVPTLPIPEECLLQPGEHFNPNRLHMLYWHYYAEWKKTLPRKAQAKLPKIRYERPYDAILSTFVPFRWFEYISPDEADPNNPDYSAGVFQEREMDMARLRIFLKFLKKQGAPLDEDKVKFGCMVDIHPRDDWRAH